MTANPITKDPKRNMRSRGLRVIEVNLFEDELLSLLLFRSDSSFRLHRTDGSSDVSGGFVVLDFNQTESLFPLELEAKILSLKLVSEGRFSTEKETTELVFEDPFE